MSEKAKNERGSITHARLHFAQPYAEGYKDWLYGRKYTAGTITGLFRLLRRWTDLVHRAGFNLDTIHAGYDASAKVLKGTQVTEARLRAGALFIQYLQELGKVPSRPQPPSETEIWPILGAYEDWMTVHRGVTESTLLVYRSAAVIPLLEKLGDDAKAYSVRAIREFVLERGRPYGHSYAKLVTTATRSFLRYLSATGQSPAGREYAVPGFNGSRSKPADFVVKEDIERLLASCRGKNQLRDRAIILLLARLGLRASEVANLEFGQVDWTRGRFTIAGKSRRMSFLPLPQEVGDALIAYIEEARPPLKTPRIFLRSCAPYASLPACSVYSLVTRVMQRSGIDFPRKGPHILRHSAATTMLKQGVSLEGIGAVLRHRSIRMTMHYAKVDFELLSEIAQPWAGRSAC
ncbi:MAG: tyrosine-type recombinase/integrase [Terracidiphilus sp.]